MEGRFHRLNGTVNVPPHDVSPWATRLRSAIAPALAATLVLSGCGDPIGPEPIQELPRALTAGERALIDAGNDFAVDLLRRVHGAAPDSTVFLSPLSASMALGMTMNGAAGATLDQMRQ